VPDDPLNFTVVPHRSVGLDCARCIMLEPDGEQVALKCNECGAVVGTIKSAIARALTRAISDGITVHKLDELDAPKVLDVGIGRVSTFDESEKCADIFQ
jgi:hypothetical protein